MIMLSEFFNSFLIKNYISIQNLLNNMKIIENHHQNVFYYYFCFNKNKQITIFIIISKFSAFIKIIHMNYIFLFQSFLYLYFLFCLHIWIRNSIQLLTSQKIELMHNIICKQIWRSLQLKKSFSFKNKIIADHVKNQIIKILIRFVFFTVINNLISWLLIFINFLTLKKARQKKHNF